MNLTTGETFVKHLKNILQNTDEASKDGKDLAKRAMSLGIKNLEERSRKAKEIERWYVDDGQNKSDFEKMGDLIIDQQIAFMSVRNHLYNYRDTIVQRVASQRASDKEVSEFAEWYKSLADSLDQFVMQHSKYIFKLEKLALQHKEEQERIAEEERRDKLDPVSRGVEDAARTVRGIWKSWFGNGTKGCMCAACEKPILAGFNNAPKKYRRRYKKKFIKPN